MVTDFFPTGKDLRFTGGVEARTFFVAKYLAKHHQVHVICSRETGTTKLQVIQNIKIHRVGPQTDYLKSGSVSSVLQRLAFIKSAVETGKRIKPDIVDGGNFVGNLIAREIARQNKIPCIYWYPDVFIGQWLKTSGMITGMSGFLLEKINLSRGAQQFIAISQTTKNKLIKNGIPAAKITVIPCGVDTGEFRKQHSQENKIICISRLVGYKRLQDLIWAFALVIKRLPKIKLLIVGRGPDEKNLKQIVKMLKLESKVSFKKNLKRQYLISQIQSSKILCLPSETEGFGIAVIEAAAAGVPYIVSDIEVLKEITKNGQGGLIFKLGDVKDLAEKIKKLLSHDKLYEEKSKEALNLSKNYNWSDIAKQTEKIYLKTSRNFR